MKTTLTIVLLSVLILLLLVYGMTMRKAYCETADKNMMLEDSIHKLKGKIKELEKLKIMDSSTNRSEPDGR